MSSHKQTKIGGASSSQQTHIVTDTRPLTAESLEDKRTIAKGWPDDKRLLPETIF